MRQYTLSIIFFVLLYTSYFQSCLPQYANFLPKYFPIYGTTTIVSSSSSCCKLASHSFCASDLYSDETEDTSDESSEEGKESISSLSDAGPSNELSPSKECADCDVEGPREAVEPVKEGNM